jgi:hypothetical protein
MAGARHLHFQAGGFAGVADVPEGAFELGLDADDEAAGIKRGEDVIEFGAGAKGEAADFAVEGEGVDLVAVLVVEGVEDFFGNLNFAGSHMIGDLRYSIYDLRGFGFTRAVCRFVVVCHGCPTEIISEGPLLHASSMVRLNARKS